MAVSDIFVGAVTKGVNVPTVAALNVVLLAFVFVCFWLLYLGSSSQPWLLPHAIFMLCMSLGLTLAINWLILCVGTTSVRDQERELYGEQGKPVLSDMQQPSGEEGEPSGSKALDQGPEGPVDDHLKN